MLRGSTICTIGAAGSDAQTVLSGWLNFGGRYIGVGKLATQLGKDTTGWESSSTENILRNGRYVQSSWTTQVRCVVLSHRSVIAFMHNSCPGYKCISLPKFIKHRGKAWGGYLQDICEDFSRKEVTKVKQREDYAGIDCDILWTQEEKSEDANNCISATFCYYKGESVGIWVFEYLFEGNLICRNS